nr:uncharacterized protein LOC121132031 isoform X1 [Lepeophtheirus salmonis]
MNTSHLIIPDTNMFENEIIIHQKWAGASWMSSVSGVMVKFSEELGPADFQTYPSNVLLLINEDDYVAESRTYKTKLAKFYNSVINCEGLKGTVICVKSSDLTDTAFIALQTFCIIDLGLQIIPIRNIASQLPQLLVQFSISNNRHRKVNPFKFGIDTNESNSSTHGYPDPKLIETLSTIYGLSDLKARLLLEKFGSIYEIARLSVSTMAPVIGTSAARFVFNFFHQKRN